METKMASKKSLRVHWRGEDDKTETNGPGQQGLNGILKNSTVNVKNEIIPEKQPPLQNQQNNKRVQNFIDPNDPKRQRQEFQNVPQIRQKQRAPLPPNIRTYGPAPVPMTANRKIVGGPPPQQFVYLQQPGGSTRRIPPGYRSSRPQSAHHQMHSSRTLPPYRIAPPQLDLLDDNSPQIRLGRYRPKVIQEHFSPNNVRDTEFLNKRREKSAPPEKRKSVQTHTWERQKSPEVKVNVTRQDTDPKKLRTKTIVRLKASPIQPHNPQWEQQNSKLVSTVTIPSKSSSTKDDKNGNFVIVDYVVDNLGPQMLQMKLTENGDSNGQTTGSTDNQVNRNGPASIHPHINSNHTTVGTEGVENGVEMIEIQKQILQKRQSEASLAQLPIK
ncbi:uncharacterized protein [Argopecten irradians]|uniref:uncharacterized protein n=1 Tax=Argopecten irradians TaxID=31199 RepID=UPI00371F3107